MDGNEREVSTNGERVANQRDLLLTNRKQVLLGEEKRKVESDKFNFKKRWENMGFGGQQKDQTYYKYCNIPSLYQNTSTI
jgi:hypothetical protein